MQNSTGSTPELIEYECECLDKKKFRIVFDGASTGNYIIELCLKCYQTFDRRFLLSEEIVP